jgi:DNA-binding MarR family transcriptional regulator
MKLQERYLAAARQCTAAQLRRASRLVSRIYDDAMAPSGLQGTQFSLLVALSLTGEVPMSKLAEHLALDRTTLTRNLAPLERDGWVASGVGLDHRQRLVRLTELGRRTLEEALPLWEAAQQQVVVGMGQQRWRELAKLLDSLESLEPTS